METTVLSLNPEVRKPFDNFGRRMMRISPFDIQAKMWAVILMVMAVLFVLLASAYNWKSPSNAGSLYFPEQQSEKPKDVYGIVFDAGSTGSRIHIFHFLINGPEDRVTPIGTIGKQMTLVKDTFREIKPGLSAYANDVDKAASSLVGMLEEAKATVPQDLQHSCPIALKATAGLRLLGTDTAKNILNKVRTLFKTYPFPMADGSVEIMDGMDEGVFSWITVNYMLDLLSHPPKTVAALDLGGGSTQLTFVPFRQETLAAAPPDFTKKISLVGNAYTLYTHSYLGLGLMSARHAMMHKIPGDPAKLTTPCFPLGVTETATKEGHKYVISARAENNGFDQCYSIAKELVLNNVKSVDELKEHHILIFSYFYDRAVDSGLVGVDGGNVTVKDFASAAVRTCEKPLSGHPYLCMDLVYIYAILHDGYTLHPLKTVQLGKKVKGIEISWALGAVFDLFDKTKTLKF